MAKMLPPYWRRNIHPTVAHLGENNFSAQFGLFIATYNSHMSIPVTPLDSLNDDHNRPRPTPI